MSIKFGSKSDGVKGLSFHLTKPWILASLESGIIQLWDYRMETLIDQFEHHRGPVHGLHFHMSQPFFVSGGNDHRVKVWNYMLRRCMFNLLGHLDNIRTVQFHNKHPWIVSASDDHTIRIWNWETRTCISTLTRHTRSVMSASFHPYKGLIVSASLDKTVRVWDIGPLVEKTPGRMKRLSWGEKQVAMSADAFLKFVLRGHKQGVNWASFHAASDRIISGGDDHQVKIWEMNFSCTNASEVTSLRGHKSKVSCVLCHKCNYDIIVSSSEDRSILVWDASTKTRLQTLDKEHNRFSILASHPKTVNLFAAGHENGMIVFKLERNRPVFSMTGDIMCNLFNFQGCKLRLAEYTIKEETNIGLFLIQRPHCPYLNNQGVKMLSYNSTEDAVLLCSDVDGGSYELYIIPKHFRGSCNEYMPEVGKGSGGWAVFVAGNRFAVLDNRTNQIFVKNLENEIIEKISLPIVTDAIFSAGTGNLLCRAEDRVFVFDLHQSIILGELQTSLVRYVVWSNDMSSVALLTKYSIVIASKKLVHHCTLHEKMRIKSGAWDDNGVFIYTTPNQIKYCLPNGDSGIIKNLKFPLFIAKVFGRIIFGLDEQGHVQKFVIDTTEYLIKFYLLKKRYEEVMSMVGSSDIYGHAVVAYLQQKGLPEFALHFAKDEKTRFNLALEIGDIQAAFASAKVTDEKNHWHRLGVEALRQGNVGITKYAYKSKENFERLSFLHLITGNLGELSKMKKIFETNNNVMGSFHNALYLGDIRERVKVLENVGHLHLAYVTAVVHGLHETAKRLAAELGDNIPCLPAGKSPSLLVPPRPIICGGDWPLLRVMSGTIKGGPDNVGWNKGEFEAANGNCVDGFDIIVEEHLQNGEVSDYKKDDRIWAIEDVNFPPKTASKHHACSTVNLAPVSEVSVIQKLQFETSMLSVEPK